MTNELKKAIETVKVYLDMDSDVDSEYLNAQRTIIDALEAQPTDAVDLHIPNVRPIQGKRYSASLDIRTNILSIEENDNGKLSKEDVKFLHKYMPQPCEDCVSRQAVINAICAWGTNKERNSEVMIPMAEVKQSIADIVADLPSVLPNALERVDSALERVGDAVSREAVINLINHSLCDLKRDADKQIFINTINSLPSAQPQSCEDCISREAVRELICQNNDYYGYSDRFHEFTEKCLHLPPVTPQKPRGKWIKHEIRDTCRWLTCSICGYEWINKKENFCPNCGAEMSEDRSKQNL